MNTCTALIPYPRHYSVSVDSHSLIVTEDSEDGLYLLIEQRTGMPRVAAEAMLAKGMLIFSDDLAVCRQDVIDKIMRDAEESISQSLPEAKPRKRGRPKRSPLGDQKGRA